VTTLDRRTDRIENAVERELARRRRLLRLYLLLMLVPLGLAAWFLAAGRSDQATFRQTVEERVAPVEQSYEKVASKLEQVENLDLPMVQQAAEKLQEQEKQVAALQDQVVEIRASQTTILRTIEPAGELKELSDRLMMIEGRLKNVQAQQSEIQRDLTTVQQRIDKQPGRPVLDLDPKRLNELIDARIRVLEKSRAEIRDHRQPPPPR
jgi:hypothetical protein